MPTQIKQRLHSRQNAGRLLAEKLISYKHTNAIVLAIPRGGVPVGRQISSSLNLPFEVAFLRRIKHPGHPDLSIGAVGLDEIVLHESSEFIPQSYIHHQIAAIQRTLREEFARAYGNSLARSLKDSVVIVVDDVLRELDEISACLQSIRKQQPEKIVVAAAVATVKAVQLLAEEQIEFHCLLTEFHTHTRAHSYFPELTAEEKADFKSADFN